MQILIPEVPILEKIIRPIVVYAFLLIAFRLAGKRELGQMTPFDLIVLLTISNVLQNAMIGSDNSLGGGLIGGLTLFVVNGALSRIMYRFPRLAEWLSGGPTVLIENGRIVEPNMRREVMTLEELQRSLRHHNLGWEDVTQIRRALLELDGTVTIQLKGTTAAD
ncbi:MAG TPA: YetF domain-containing protein [Anaerolineae bacterium]